jgi:CTP:molybdopterin cytidylyltransferase MocA
VEGVVIAAGEGRRLRPVTERWPKPILPIDGKPVIATLLRELEAADVVPVIVVVGHLGAQIRRLLADLDLQFAEQPERLGSADAVRRAIAVGARAPFVVAVADTVFAPGEIGRFVSAWQASGADAAMAPPLWGLGPKLVPLLEGLPGPPFELRAAFERAPSVERLELEPTRSLTEPADLVAENFVYLEGRHDE